MENCGGYATRSGCQDYNIFAVVDRETTAKKDKIDPASLYRNTTVYYMNYQNKRSDWSRADLS